MPVVGVVVPVVGVVNKFSTIISPNRFSLLYPFTATLTLEVPFCDFGITCIVCVFVGDESVIILEEELH